MWQILTLYYPSLSNSKKCFNYYYIYIVYLVYYSNYKNTQKISRFTTIIFVDLKWQFKFLFHKIFGVSEIAKQNISRIAKFKNLLRNHGILKPFVQFRDMELKKFRNFGTPSAWINKRNVSDCWREIEVALEIIIKSHAATIIWFNASSYPCSPPETKHWLQG